jgi:hypothetical protein
MKYYIFWRWRQFSGVADRIFMAMEGSFAGLWPPTLGFVF